MQRILSPDHTIRVSRNSGRYQQREWWLGVRHQGPHVVLLISPSRDISAASVVPMTTVEAHRVGWDLLNIADDCIRDENGAFSSWNGQSAKESVILAVNGYPINVSVAKARKIGAALFRKADVADDFQLENKVRMVK